MLVEHSFISGSQKPPAHPFAFPALARTYGGALLGNEAIQVVHHLGYRPTTTKRLSRLEELKRRRFPPETKAERVERSLAALYRQTSIRLTSEQWRELIEDPDIHDEL